jgi:hypothetical protein
LFFKKSSTSLKRFADLTLNRDLGDVRTKYKGLLPGAPQEVQTLVKPTQLLLATRLGYKVKLGSSSPKQFDSYYKDTVSGGGSVSIFDPLQYRG